jgi:tRNA modification GTPase
MAQYRGALSRQIEAWRTRLIDAMALVEAAIDFSDEGDVPQDLLAPAAGVARELGEEIKRVLDDARRGERLRDGFVVAIAGAPNVGKSTLLNRLAAREVAIVSPTPGTTRDAIEVALDLGGVPVVLVDTAGVRETNDPVESEGVRRALARAEAADLVLWLVDASEAKPGRATREHAIEVWTKIDLLDSEAQRMLSAQGSIRISAKIGLGMDELIAMLAREASTLAGEPALITHERQRHALKEAAERLDGALEISAAGQEELFAEDLRLAARALGRVTGVVDVEDVLEAVFLNFCVGK